MGKPKTVRLAEAPVPRPLGAHMSISGGYALAVERAAQIGATALQIFTRSQLQWRIPPLDPADAEQFRAALNASPIRFVCAHDSYLTNLASPDPHLRKRSRDTFVEELKRADLLGCACLILHPGSPKNDPREVGLQRVADALSFALERTEGLAVRIALENTAGHGSGLGSTFEDLATVLSAMQWHPRAGVCLDTCHALAAGYELRTPDAAAELARVVARTVGAERLLVMHFNDSKHGRGSHLDRHEHIGKGAIGEEGFRTLLHEPGFRGVPGIIETPKGEQTLDLDRENLERLRSLVETGPVRGS